MMVDCDAIQSRTDDNPEHFELLKSLPKRLWARWSEWRSRRGLNDIAKLSDDMLRDIGVSRDDIRWASSQPLDVDAAEMLNRLARRAT